MITLFLFPSILTQENCSYYLGAAAYEKLKNKDLLLVWESLYYEQEYFQKIAKIYEDFFVVVVASFCINDIYLP